MWCLRGALPFPAAEGRRRWGAGGIASAECQPRDPLGGTEMPRVLRSGFIYCDHSWFFVPKMPPPGNGNQLWGKAFTGGGPIEQRPLARGQFPDRF